MSGRKRSPNFTTAEIEIFLDLLSGKRGEIVESKKTDASCVKEKEKEWKKIESEFKARSGTSRDAKNLKLLWKRLKIDAKKKDAQCKRETRRTGGGLPQNPLTLSPVSERVVGILPKEQVTPSVESPFDSDGMSQPTSYLAMLDEDSDDDAVHATGKQAADIADIDAAEAGPSSAEREPKKKKKDEEEMTPFQREILRMATIEHKAKMKVLKLKEQYYLNKLNDC